MKVSKINENNLSNNHIDKLLFNGCYDKGNNGDIALVIGSEKATIYKIPKLASMYVNNRVPLAIMSGGRLIKHKDKLISIAELMKLRAVQLGVAESSIYLDKKSQSIKESLENSYKLIKNKLIKANKVLLVTNTYQMRRTWLLSKLVFSNSIAVELCPANDSFTKRINWYKSSSGVKRATSEAVNIIKLVRNHKDLDFII